MVDPDLQPLVFDIGSGYAKVGFGGHDAPRSVIPTLVGRPKDPSFLVEMGSKDCYIGEEAFAKQSILKLKHPVEHGMVVNWNDMEKIWHHAFYNELQVCPEEHPVVLTEAPLTPKNNREKMISIMFETFNVVALYVGIRAVLSLTCAGKTTGLVLSSGDGVTHAVPVYEGYPLPHAILRSNLAGSDVSAYLSKVLSETREFPVDTPAAQDNVREIKEAFCYVASDFQEEMSRADDQSDSEFELPDGSKLAVGSVRFQAPEILFNPQLIDFDGPGVHENVFNCIQKCDEDIREDLFGTIYVAGGTTMFKGFGQRLAKELRSLAPAQMDVKVHAPLERKFSSWIGGSILSTLPSFQNVWITKEEYDDCGPGYISRRKCF